MYLAVVNFYLEKGYKLDVLNDSIFEHTSDYCIYIRIKEFDERFRYTFEIRFIDSKEKALNIAKQLYHKIKNFLISQDVPIYYKNNGFGDYINEDSYYPALITEYFKMEPEVLLPDLKGKRLENEVIGYDVIKLDFPIQDIRFVTQDIKIDINKKFDKSLLDNLVCRSDKELIAIDIYNLSNINKDIRIAFIMLITAIEVLVGDQVYKPDNYRKMIKQINKKVLKKEKINEIITEDFNDSESIIEYVKNSVGMLGKKSIQEKCSSLIETCYFHENFYNDLNTVDFFIECYELRSKFIHAGSYDFQDMDSRRIKLKDLIKGVLKLS